MSVRGTITRRIMTKTWLPNVATGSARREAKDSTRPDVAESVPERLNAKWSDSVGRSERPWTREKLHYRR